ncbi:MAG TPA: glycosyltransferase [Spirochaetia bacterium]|nr:glycosyltransferase [Spirochaetia bacterium]
MIFSLLILLLVVLGAAILSVHLFCIVGIFRAIAAERHTQRSVGKVPSVSLVVPARNEEILLPRLLSSLEKLDTSDVPDFELVLVNDRSTDSTPQIMQKFAAGAPWPVRIIDTPEPTPPLVRTNPKQNALHYGTLSAHSQLLLFTDADCVVETQWLRRMVLPFRDESLGLLFGTVMPKAAGMFLPQYQGFDHVFRYYYTAGSAGLGNPTGGFGNNIAVRASALAEVGGFSGLRYSVTEDAELIAEVRDLHRYEVRPLIAAEAIVSPEPQRHLSELVTQSIRWNTGGLYAPDRAARYSYRVVMLFLLGSVLALLLSPIFPPLLFTTAGSFLSMTLVAIIAGIASRRGFRYWVMLLPNVLFSMAFYSFVTFQTLARRPIRWKGRILNIRAGRSPSTVAGVQKESPVSRS